MATPFFSGVTFNAIGVYGSYLTVSGSAVFTDEFGGTHDASVEAYLDAGYSTYAGIFYTPSNNPAYWYPSGVSSSIGGAIVGYSGSNHYPNQAPGVYQVYILARYSIYGLGTAGATATGTITITGTPLAGSFTAADKIADGNTNATVLSTGLSGVVVPDSVTLIAGQADFEDANVGVDKVVSAGAGWSLSGTDAYKYTLSGVADTTATIVNSSDWCFTPIKGDNDEEMPGFGTYLASCDDCDDDNCRPATPDDPGARHIYTDGPNTDQIGACVYLYRHIPTQFPSSSELWAAGPNVTMESFYIARKDDAWEQIIPDDAPEPSLPDAFRMAGATLHQKHFFAYRSEDGTDRLHVWDGNVLRRAGLAEPEAVPVVADEGVGGYTGVVHVRVRWVEIDDDGTVLRRSEPSEQTDFTPSTAGAGFTVTMPTIVTDEHQTHWEVEAADDEAPTDFYRLAQTLITTTTYNVETAPLDFATVGELSEDIGEYSLIESVEFVAVGEDRLLVGGAFEDETHSCRIGWTRVGKAEGAGNDERMPTNIDSFKDLDTFTGGGLTGISGIVNGAWYAFKLEQIHKQTPTSKDDDAFDTVCISQTEGAIKKSVVKGSDENGRPCVYFLNPKTGPARIGINGLQLHRDLRRWWQANVNLDATVCARVVYYNDKRQVWWWIATGTSDVPNLVLVLQTNAIQPHKEGICRGLTMFDGDMSFCYDACMYAENIDDAIDNDRSNHLVPFIATTIQREVIQRCDVNDTDNGEGYTATVITRPFTLAGILNEWKTRIGGVLARAATGVTLRISLKRDYGLETRAFETDLTPEGTEDFVFRTMDDLKLSEATTMQFIFHDTIPATGRWFLDQFSFKPSSGMES